jgi:hypothetical protein
MPEKISAVEPVEPVKRVLKPIERVELPSGGWIEYRTGLKASDKFAVQDAVVLEYTDGEARKIRGGTTNVMRNALLARIITAWSFEGIPIPAQNIAGVDTLGDTLDIDDYNVLAEDVSSLLDKVAFTSSPNQRKSGS